MSCVQCYGNNIMNELINIISTVYHNKLIDMQQNLVGMWELIKYLNRKQYLGPEILQQIYAFLY